MVISETFVFVIHSMVLPSLSSSSPLAGKRNMTGGTMTAKISGLWLPIITPFKNGAVDFASYERLIEHYLALGVDGLFPLGTTGESPALDAAETDELVERTVAKVAGRVPVFVGVGGNATHKVEKTL